MTMLRTLQSTLAGLSVGMGAGTALAQPVTDSPAATVLATPSMPTAKNSLLLAADVDFEQFLASDHVSHHDFFKFTLYALNQHLHREPLPKDLVASIQKACEKRLTEKLSADEGAYIVYGLDRLLGRNEYKKIWHDANVSAETKLHLCILLSAGAHVTSQSLIKLALNMPECVQENGKAVMQPEWIMAATQKFVDSPTEFVKKNFGNSTGIFNHHEMVAIASSATITIYSTGGIMIASDKTASMPFPIPMDKENILTPVVITDAKFGSAIVFTATPRSNPNQIITDNSYFIVGPSGATFQLSELIQASSTYGSPKDTQDLQILFRTIKSLQKLRVIEPGLLANAAPQDLKFLEPAQRDFIKREMANKKNSTSTASTAPVDLPDTGSELIRELTKEEIGKIVLGPQTFAAQRRRTR